MLKYVTEFKYLGVNLCCTSVLSRSFAAHKVKFYKSFYAIYSKCKFASSELPATYLLISMCLPVLSYAIEAFPPSVNEYKVLDNLIYRALARVYRTYDASIINYIKSIFSIHKTRDYLSFRQSRFLRLFGKKKLSFCDVILSTCN